MHPNKGYLQSYLDLPKLFWFLNHCTSRWWLWGRRCKGGYQLHHSLKKRTRPITPWSHIPLVLWEVPLYLVPRRCIFFVAELASLPPTNPPAIVLSIWRTTLSRSSLYGPLPFMDPRFLVSTCPQELDSPNLSEKSPLTYLLRCPSWMRRLIFFLSW